MIQYFKNVVKGILTQIMWMLGKEKKIPAKKEQIFEILKKEY